LPVEPSWSACSANYAGALVIVTKLDRLGRSMRDLLGIVDRIEAAEASLQIRGMSPDTGTPTGRLMLTVFGGGRGVRARHDAGKAARGHRQSQG
jgi:hypothetical protein